MRAIVISGGGSKGAFAGGVAQYLIERQQRDYDLFVGTSTGSLLLIHLALQKIEKLHSVPSLSICSLRFPKCHHHHHLVVTL